ncbi:MAG: hypothetical protein V4804_12305 [Pseudomonadota bacterium]|jgi:hypothetical protein
MPKLIHLYISSIAVGFALAVVFVVSLVALDVAGLRHLILGSDMGWVAAAMMVMFNGVVFSAVQFAIRIMGMAERDETPRGGTLMRLTPIPVTVTAAKGKPRQR